MAAAGRAVTWPKTPGPGRQGGYARNSSHQGDLEEMKKTVSDIIIIITIITIIII